MRQGELEETARSVDRTQQLQRFTEPEIAEALGVVREEVTVPSQGHRSQGSIPNPRSGVGAPGVDRKAAVSAGIMPGVPGSPQPGLTWASERPGGSEAGEATDCPGGHHLEQERTKEESAPTAGGPPGHFCFPSLVLARRPTYCLTETPMLSCRRPPIPALRFRLAGRKGLPLLEGRPVEESSFPVRRPVGSREASGGRGWT